MVAEEQQQQHADTDGGDGLGDDPGIDEVLQRVDPQQVHRQSQRQQQRAAEHLAVGRRRRAGRQQAEPEATEVGHGSQRGQRRSQVEEAGEPGQAVAHQAPHPLVAAAGQRKLRGQLGVDQRHAELQQQAQRHHPDPGGAHAHGAEGHHRVDAHHRRDGGEADGKGRPQAQPALQFLAIAVGRQQAFVAGGIAEISHGGLRASAAGKGKGGCHRCDG